MNRTKADRLEERNTETKREGGVEAEFPSVGLMEEGFPGRTAGIEFVSDAPRMNLLFSNLFLETVEPCTSSRTPTRSQSF